MSCYLRCNRLRRSRGHGRAELSAGTCFKIDALPGDAGQYSDWAGSVDQVERAVSTTRFSAVRMGVAGLVLYRVRIGPTFYGISGGGGGAG